MPDLPVVVAVLTLLADATIFLFVGYYFFRLRSKEIEIDTREGKFDRDYHAIVDSALAKERKIIEDATAAGDQIIAKAKEINSKVTEDINKALENMSVETQREAKAVTKRLLEEHQRTLESLTRNAETEMAEIYKQMREMMKDQVSQFNQITVPALKAEIEAYKNAKMAEADEKAIKIAQKAAEEIFGKGLALEDKQKLIVEALDKAKKEGVFE